MTFKDFLLKDIDDTFLNTFEFAEELLINGETVRGVLDYKEDITGKTENDGVSSAVECFLYLKDDPKFHTVKYKRGKSMEIGDETFVIVLVGKQQGMLSFKLNRNEGY